MLGAGSRKLGARENSFGQRPKPTGQRPVLPMVGRPNGATVGQPSASAAPRWGGRAAQLHFQTSSEIPASPTPPLTTRAPPHPNQSRVKAAARQELPRAVERASSCLEWPAPNPCNGFRRAAETEGQRPVVITVIVAGSQTARVRWLSEPTGKSVLLMDIVGQGQTAAACWSGYRRACRMGNRVEFGPFWAFELVLDFGFGALSFGPAERGLSRVKEFCHRWSGASSW